MDNLPLCIEQASKVSIYWLRPMTMDLRIRILFFTFFALLAVIYAQGWIAGWILLLAVAWYVTLVSFGVADVSFQYYFPLTCRGKTSARQIAITFDDGPIAGNTERILEILRNEQITATFFCIGRRVEENPQLVRTMISEGHIVGNHSFAHPHYFAIQSTAKICRDLERCADSIMQVTGKRPRFFRPPNGVSTPSLAKAIEQQNLLAIGWSLRSFDTVIRNAALLRRRILRLVAPGAILLFHDYGDATVQLLPQIIRELRARGFEFVALDALIGEKAYFGSAVSESSQPITTFRPSITAVPL